MTIIPPIKNERFFPIKYSFLKFVYYYVLVKLIRVNAYQCMISDPFIHISYSFFFLCIMAMGLPKFSAIINY